MSEETVYIVKATSAEDAVAKVKALKAKDAVDVSKAAAALATAEKELDALSSVADIKAFAEELKKFRAAKTWQEFLQSKVVVAKDSVTKDEPEFEYDPHIAAMMQTEAKKRIDAVKAALSTKDPKKLIDAIHKATNYLFMVTASGNIKYDAKQNRHKAETLKSIYDSYAALIKQFEDIAPSIKEAAKRLNDKSLNSWTGDWYDAQVNRAKGNLADAKATYVPGAAKAA
jgi:hypothetical protein